MYFTYIWWMIIICSLCHTEFNIKKLESLQIGSISTSSVRKHLCVCAFISCCSITIITSFIFILNKSIRSTCFESLNFHLDVRQSKDPQNTLFECCLWDHKNKVVGERLQNSAVGILFIVLFLCDIANRCLLWWC